MKIEYDIYMYLDSIMENIFLSVDINVIIIFSAWHHLGFVLYFYIYNSIKKTKFYGKRLDF